MQTYCKEVEAKILKNKEIMKAIYLILKDKYLSQSLRVLCRLIENLTLQIVKICRKIQKKSIYL